MLHQCHQVCHGPLMASEEKALIKDLVHIHHAAAATAAAKSLHSCPTLCHPIDGSPPGSPVPGILQTRILEWVAISFSNACMHAKSLQSCLTLCDPWTAAHQAALYTGFSRQEYWSGLPFPSPHIHHTNFQNQINHGFPCYLIELFKIIYS